MSCTEHPTLLWDSGAIVLKPCLIKNLKLFEKIEIGGFYIDSERQNSDTVGNWSAEGA